MNYSNLYYLINRNKFYLSSIYKCSFIFFSYIHFSSKKFINLLNIYQIYLLFYYLIYIYIYLIKFNWINKSKFFFYKYPFTRSVFTFFTSPMAKKKHSKKQISFSYHKYQIGVIGKQVCATLFIKFEINLYLILYFKKTNFFFELNWFFLKFLTITYFFIEKKYFNI